ncbi:MAG: DNA cytosine methyltransferase, partial [Ktedonobacteraceae bacterium]|nr:DNA cytosine methyltransferase [Ktedonobacteraceae bacterium]
MSLDITCTDMFCGAGGSTTGAVQAGVDVRLAINHWSRAIETHNTNYPNTKHALTDLHKASPKRFPTTTGLLASPECTSHSLAKGRQRKLQGQPSLWDTGEPDLTTEAEERSRCTMWTPLDWAEYHKYEFLILENVVDTHLWRPFKAWLHAWECLGYEFEIVYLNSMHAHPTPQSRDRMYFVAWRRGNRKPNLKITPRAFCQRCDKNVESIQSWKNPSRRYGKYKQQYVYCCPHCACEVIPYYFAAANAIDWSLPTPRIGDRVKPLKEKTLARIAYGLEKFGIPMTRVQDRLRSVLRDAFPTQTATETQGVVMPPFLLNLNHSEPRPAFVDASPFPTQTGFDSTGLTIPPALLMQLSHGGSNAGRIAPAGETSFPTQTAREDLAVVVPPFLMDHLGEYRPRSLERAFSTICAAGNHHSLVVPPQAWLMTYYNNGQLCSVEGAAPTITTLARHALVTSEGGGIPAVEDCGFRMLVPDEIKRVMAF